ncbi:MAG: hypothetical protein QOH54_2802, partial [Mycobacterium sp.]|nr:hypothetical protein [Mycobacterium sp.]
MFVGAQPGGTVDELPHDVRVA